MKRISQIFIIIAAICITFGSATAQTKTNKTEKPQAKLLDEFGVLGGCEFGARIDQFFIELQNNKDLQGYVILYNSIENLPANLDTYINERLISQYITLRRFDKNRVVIVQGGFRESRETELWVIPSGADFPSPRQTLPRPIINVNRPTLFDTSVMDYRVIGIAQDPLDEPETDYEPLVDFIFPHILQMEEAERQAMMAEWGDDEGDEHTENSEEFHSNDDKGTIQKEKSSNVENKFFWLSDKFRDFLSKNESFDGFVIFYADDERYDISRLHPFVIEGISTMQSTLPNNNIKVIYGGYRDSVVAEYYVVPKGGVEPQPKPEVRRIEDESNDQ